MSYASVVEQGPSQELEDKVAPAPPQIERNDPVAHVSLVDVDSTSVHTVPSDFKSQEIQTDTEANRIEDEHIAEEAKIKAAEEDLKIFLKDQEKKVKTEEEEAKAEEEEAKAEEKKFIDHALARTEDHISLFNKVVGIALCSSLGFGAYRKYIAGELDWKVVGVWTGIVGALAIANFNFTQFFNSQFHSKG